MAHPTRRTAVSIRGADFLINGLPTYPGRTWNGHRIEGLLHNSRMVQGIFDDLNPDTRGRWDYPDGPWDADRNTREFVAAMPAWREHGLLSFTINLQGGSPEGYSRDQPWHNSAYTESGELRPDYMRRLALILDKADELGMAPMVGLFYFGQDQRLRDETAVLDATYHAIDWILQQGYTHVLIEIANECDIRYDHPVIRPRRAHELITRVREQSKGRLAISTSFSGGKLPSDNVVEAADFILLHGNGVGQPDAIRRMVDDVRAMASYRGQPIVFNEDDHYGFDKPDNNFIAAVSRGAGWGYFDFRRRGEGFNEGYQSVPVDWGISSARKRGFFDLLRQMTG
jgi:hypothetical protein